MEVCMWSRDMHNLYLIESNWVPESILDIVVTWSTVDKTNDSVVEYGINGLENVAEGTSVKFTDGGVKKSSQYIHRVSVIIIDRTWSR